MSDVALRTPQQIAWARFRRTKTEIASGIAVIFSLVLAYRAPTVPRLFGHSSTNI